ncbi:unnamed protein product, partial [Iphiclides podalirius]
MVRHASSRSEIQSPDVRSPSNPKFMTALVTTNRPGRVHLPQRRFASGRLRERSSLGDEKGEGGGSAGGRAQHLSAGNGFVS